MSGPILSTYADFAEAIVQLPVVLRAARRMRGLSLRAAAKEIGISFSTVDRVESGKEIDTGTLVAVMRWLDDNTRHHANGGAR